MIDGTRHNTAIMVTTVGRDPAWTHRAMADLFARATQLNMSPVVWELGFFALRDLIGTKDPAFQERAWDQVRLETVWGCGISIESLGDVVALVARGTLAGSSAEFHRFQAEGTSCQE